MSCNLYSLKEHYNKAFIEHYDKNLVFFDSYIKYAEMVAFFKIIKEIGVKIINSKIMEAGSLSGRYSLTLAKNGAKVTGIDISRYGILQAQERAREMELSNVKFLNKDFSYPLPFDENEFDIIISMMGTINHISKIEIEKVLTNILRHLKNEGYFIFTLIANSNNLYFLRYKSNDLYKLITSNFYTVGNVSSILSNLNFEVLRVLNLGYFPPDIFNNIKESSLKNNEKLMKKIWEIELIFNEEDVSLMPTINLIIAKKEV